MAKGSHPFGNVAGIIMTAATARPLPLAAWSLRSSAVIYLVATIALPAFAIVATGFENGIGGFVDAITAPVAWHAIALTLGMSASCAIINAVCGTVIALVLARREFVGKRVLNAVIDFPFAVPALVAGIMLVELLGPTSLVGGALAKSGIEIITELPAIALALLFVTLPFVVRAVLPVLEDFDAAEEEAATMLGASPLRILFTVVVPRLYPAVRTGALLSFARCLGEFGAVVVVSGNIPLESLYGSVYITGEIEAGNLVAASAVATFLLAISFAAITAVDIIERRRGKRHG